MTPHEDAELAVLEMALAEELGAEAPPKLWPRLQPGAPAVLPRRSARWLAAAVLTIGVGIVASLMTWVRQPLRPLDALDQHSMTTEKHGPKTFAEALQRLESTERATVVAKAVQSTASGQWYALDQHPLEDFLQSAPNPRDLDSQTFEMLLTALRSANSMPVSGDEAPWTHTIELAAPVTRERRNQTAQRLVLLVARQANGGQQLAFAGANGPIPVAATAFPAAQLAAVFEEATELKVARRGFVLGDTALADSALAKAATTATRLRLCEVGPNSLMSLQRFPKLRQLDLSASPELHNANALSALRGLPLHTLQLRAMWLDAQACAAIAGITTLQELFLGSPWGMDGLVAEAEAPSTTGRLAAPWLFAPRAPGIDDEALTALSRLDQLKELAIFGGTFGDRGLAQLAQLPKLQRLVLIACQQITPAGWSALAGHPLQNLVLTGCAFDQRLAMLPDLQELMVGSAEAPTSLASLAALPALTKLRVAGRLHAEELVPVAGLRQLRTLALLVEPELTDADLVHLYSATQLEHLKLGGSRVSDDGIAALRQALPKCSISRDPW